MTQRRVRIGNAPVSYGVYGAEAGGAGASPEELLTTMADAGYEGSELGPPGFFGTPETTAERFANAGLAVIGTYVPLHLGADGPELFERDLDSMRHSCEELLACGGDGVLVVADEGDDQLRLHPARDAAEAAFGLDDAGWGRLAGRLRRALDLAGTYGLACAFHPHIATFVESPADVERLLDVASVALTLDTGHIALAGGDPVACLDNWYQRVQHVHLKDVRRAVLTEAKVERRTDLDVWWGDVCVPLGTGDLDLASFLGKLLGSGYSGWLVVEQDRLPTDRSEYRCVAAEQSDNLSWVREHAGLA